MNGVETTLDKLGGLIEPAVRPLIGEDEAPKEETSDVQKLIEQNAKLMDELKKGKSEKKEMPKVKNPAPPFNMRGLPVYPVYLILPNDQTFHTQITQFHQNNEPYYYLHFNKRVYNKDEFINEETMSTDACNFIFMEDNGARLVNGKVDFSANAKEQLNNIDKMKQEDRAFEKSHWRQKSKYMPPLNINTAVNIMIVCVGIFLVAYVVITNLSPIIGALNNAPAALKPVMNQTLSRTFVG